MAEPSIQYRFHGRFISAGRAASLSNLKGASQYVSTSYREGRSHTFIDRFVKPAGAARILHREVAERRVERARPPAPRPAPPPAPPSFPPMAPPEAVEPGPPPREFFPAPPEFDYEKQGFESPWADADLFTDDLWDAMDWDGDISDIDEDIYIDLGS